MNSFESETMTKLIIRECKAVLFDAYKCTQCPLFEYSTTIETAKILNFPFYSANSVTRFEIVFDSVVVCPEAHIRQMLPQLKMFLGDIKKYFTFKNN